MPFTRKLRSWAHRNDSINRAIFAAENIFSLLRPGVRIVSSEDSQWNIVAMVRVKDEVRFLPEWLAYHRILGIEHVFVYDNGSKDGTAEAIRPFVELGYVTVVDWPYRPASPSAENDFLTRYAALSDWVAFLDADEFILERTPGLLLSALRTHPEWPALCLNWRYFGSSYHETVPSGLVIENFTFADVSEDHHVKTIARVDSIRRYRNSHGYFYRSGRLARSFGGSRVFGSFHPPLPNRISSVLINHYVYRSRDDYRRKTERGYVDARGAADRARTAERIDREFERHNDMIALPPEKTLEAVRAALHELGYPPNIYQAS